MKTIAFLYSSLFILYVIIIHLGKKEADSDFPHINIKRGKIWSKYQAQLIYYSYSFKKENN